MRELLEAYEDVATFYSPDICFDDARHYLVQVLEKRGLNPESGLSVLAQMNELVESVDHSLYVDYERLARERIELRDPDDWPVVAVALLLDLPIWTEDRDLFGSGVADVDVGPRRDLPESKPLRLTISDGHSNAQPTLPRSRLENGLYPAHSQPC